ncbi:MAG: Protoporphyrinogen and coproporphyrinogen oxidase [Armatimonadetes bacterium]|nr:Protoporphyrinogen and coproporphyrinogen oxidase [Armatimonadota bacterium]
MPAIRIAIVGGGVTGLAAAHRLLELARERGLELDLRLFEAGDRLGGVIGTVRRDGFVLELGPDSMITDKPWGLGLAKRLGLDDQLIGTQEQHRRSFVVRNGKLLPVPEGFQLLAPSKFGPLVTTPIFSPLGKLRMALDLLIPPRKGDGDESLGSFVTRRLGHEALDRIAQPMIAGIYGADPMQLSLKATLPRFLDMERDHGSVIRGMWARMRSSATNTQPPNTEHQTPNTEHRTPKSGVSGARYGLFVSFRDGMQTLTDALIARIPAETVRLDTRVDHLERQGNCWSLIDERGGITEADAVILALPAYHSARLVRHLNAELAELLAGIRYASAATMTLCYRKEDVPHPLDGFGFVVPATEKLELLGCTFTHVKYAHRAPEGVALLRVFLGDAALDGRDAATLERVVRADLAKLVGVTAAPLFTQLWQGSRCMPHYYVGHLDRMADIEQRAAELPHLALAGNAYYGVGIPDSIHSGEQAAEKVLANLAG